MIHISDEARAYVRDAYPAGFADLLLTGDGFQLDRKATEGMRRIYEDLVERGYMRRSTRGRYWWTGR